MSTKFFTNTEENTVFHKFKGILENMKDVFAFHAVVGYFRSSVKQLTDGQLPKPMLGVKLIQ